LASKTNSTRQTSKRSSNAKSTNSTSSKSTAKKSTASKSATNKSTAKGSQKKTPAKARNSKRKSAKQSALIRYEIELVLLFAFTLLSALSLHSSSMGVAGEFLRKVYLGLFAGTAYIVPYFVAIFIFLGINKNLKSVRNRYMLAFGAAFLAIMLLLTVGSMEIILELLDFNSMSLTSFEGIQMTYKNGITGQGGGVIGTMITFVFTQMLGTIGTYVIVFVLFVIALVMGTRVSILAIWEKRKIAAEKLAAIELNLPEINMPKIKTKPKSVKDAKKQMRELKKSTAMDKSAKMDVPAKSTVVGQHIEDAANHQVRESLRSKVRDFSAFDSDKQLEPREDLDECVTLPAHSIEEDSSAHTNVIGPTLHQETVESVVSDEINIINLDSQSKEPEVKLIEDVDEVNDDLQNSKVEDTVSISIIEEVGDEYLDAAVTGEVMPVSKAQPQNQKVSASNDESTETVSKSVPTDGASSSEQQKLKNSDIDAGTKVAVESTIKKAVKAEYENYKLPPLKILNTVKPPKSSKNNQAVLDKAKKLEETLSYFGVDAKVTQISRGPTITMFELEPKPGTKVSKITNLSDDIALSLAAHQVRIVAPIPGKAAVGVEIPNEDKSMVGLKDIIDTEDFKTAKSKLTFALGKDISGKPIAANLAKMPHMLIAGATGSGKSVCVNALISSILFNAKPDEVKFLMIDPKVVELSTYNGIPHLILPVVTDPKKAAVALNWAVQEMTRRYQLFAETGVKDSDSFNRKTDIYNSELGEEDKPREKLAKIVVIIDELADLMMVAPDQVEDAICRLAQMARAAGIHLIVATQRPSVDVITGIIKANIPSRIAFSVSSQTDSRTILDMAGAEKLLGQGDMLYYPTGQSKPKRIQGAFISDEEVEELVDTIKSQVDGVAYDEEILETTIQTQASENADEYLNDAIELVVHTGQASASMLQRKFRIGYNRAARLVDEMEERGMIGPSRGSKPREVLITREEFEELSI